MAFIKTGASSALQQAATAGAFLALCLNIYIIISDQWQINDIENVVLESVRRSSGLFYKCSITEGDDKRACEDFDTFFVDLPPAIIGSRILCVGGAFFGFLGTVSLLISASCTTFAAVELDEKTTGYAWKATKGKGTAGIAGGLFTVFSGILNGVAVSWFAALIVDKYQASSMLMGSGRSTVGIRMIFGHAIWVGWGCMLVAIVSGVLGVIGAMGTVKDEDEEDGYYKTYNSPYENDVQPVRDARDDYV